MIKVKHKVKHIEAPPAVPDKTHGAPENPKQVTSEEKQDRAAYMRNYMRKYQRRSRAAAKANP
jgi:hypothetical protein